MQNVNETGSEYELYDLFFKEYQWQMCCCDNSRIWYANAFAINTDIITNNFIRSTGPVEKNMTSSPVDRTIVGNLSANNEFKTLPRTFFNC